MPSRKYWTNFRVIGWFSPSAYKRKISSLATAGLLAQTSSNSFRITYCVYYIIQNYANCQLDFGKKQIIEQ